ncbi:MAG: carbohydrate ABC transporter permease [Clostridiales bacterium]|nr:carbohydrate ABC transporter permease [Clostridiales bacterium]
MRIKNENRTSGRKIRRKGPGIPAVIILVLISILVLGPVIYTIANSFMGHKEILRYYSEYKKSGGFTGFHLVPDRLSLDAYFQMLVARPDYLVKFWNSMLLSFTIVAGQVVISCLGGYAFSKLRFRYSHVIFYIVIVMMMMPYQVTLVSNFIVLEKMKMIGKYSAVIVPSFFSAFGVFLMKQSFDTIPNEQLEAASLDGASELKQLFMIAVPMNKAGIGSLVILGFIDAWNMVEMPLVLLSERYQYPLSLYLASVIADNLSLGFACGVLALFPPLMMFLFFEDELVEGITFATLK